MYVPQIPVVFGDRSYSIYTTDAILDHCFTGLVFYSVGLPCFPSGLHLVLTLVGGEVSLLEIVFVGQCEVFVFDSDSFFFPLATKLIGPRVG